MVDHWQLARTPHTFFKEGAFVNIPEQIKRYGSTVLIVSGKRSFISTESWAKLKEQLSAEGISFELHLVEREPSPEIVMEIVETMRALEPDSVLAIGGGSVIDTGKAVSAMYMHDFPVKDYLEGVGFRKPEAKKLPFIAVPTTAGTGAESTKNAVISEVGPNGYKKSLRHDHYVPDIVILDPLLSISCPPSVTAYSGMDAFTQLLESYLSTEASIISDNLALKGLALIKRSLSIAYMDGTNINARGDMLQAAYVSGICLANVGLGLVHGFASAIGGKYPIPHGLICTRLMGPVNRLTVEKILKKPDEYPLPLFKYVKVGQLFAGHSHESDIFYCEYLLESIEQWTREFNIPSLGTFGLDKEDLATIATSSSLKNHPVWLNEEEKVKILTLAV